MSNILRTNDFDVALIKLEKPVDFEHIREVYPVALPDLETFVESKEGVKATVAGWGLSDSAATSTMAILQKLEVTVFSDEECKGFYGDRYTKRMICAGYKEGGKVRLDSR